MHDGLTGVRRRRLRDEEVFRGQALSETLGNLTRQQSFSRIPLLGLSQPEVAELMQNASGGSLAPDMVAAIYGRTEGNPLFVSEVTRMLAREGFVGEQEYIATIPQGVRETIGRRLSRLSADCSQALTIASVIGREFDFKVLMALSGEVFLVAHHPLSSQHPCNFAYEQRIALSPPIDSGHHLWS